MLAVPCTLPIRAPLKVVAVITPLVLTLAVELSPFATVAVEATPVRSPMNVAVIIPVVLMFALDVSESASVAVDAVPVRVPVTVRFVTLDVVANRDPEVIMPVVLMLALLVNPRATLASFACVAVPMKDPAVIIPVVLIDPSPVNPRATVATSADVALEIVPTNVFAVTIPVGMFSDVDVNISDPLIARLLSVILRELPTRIILLSIVRPDPTRT